MVQFSAIVPVFNCEAYIEETIDSVIDSLKSFNHEILVINDGSTDTTWEKLRKFKSKITVFDQSNQGQAKAINCGLKNAAGKYSIIVNADDPLINRELFVSSWDILEENSAIVGTYPNWQIIDAKGQIIELVIPKEFSRKEFIGRFNCLIGPGGIFRTDLAREIGGWDHTFKFVPDYNFWLRMSEHGDFFHVNQTQAQWRSHEETISIGSRGRKMADERVRVMQDFIISSSRMDPRLAKMALANANYRAGILTYFDKSIKGYKFALKAIKLYPRIILENYFPATLFILFSPMSSNILVLVKKYINLDFIASKIQLRVKS
jgi:glycosyltransferase involved in cell wall biosynthesis